MAKSQKEKESDALKKYGFSSFNKPKRTPNHPTKSHAVLAKEGDKIKLIRFEQQGVRGAGKTRKQRKTKRVVALTTPATMLKTVSPTNFRLAIGAIKLNGE